MKVLLFLSFILFSVAACDKTSRTTEGQADPHESEESHRLTLFTEHSEFFIEYPELLVNRKAPFAVHLTRLENYKPYPKGTVRIVLEQAGGRKVEGSVSQPARPGIFTVGITPDIRGEGKISVQFTGEHITETVESGVWVSSDEHDEGSVEKDASLPEGIRFAKEQAWKSDFAVTLILPGTFRGIIKAGGEILAMPGEKQYMHAHTSGIVHYSKKGLVAGADVFEGEELMTIEGQDLPRDNIAVDYAEAESRYKQSRREYERRLKLFREKAVSEKQFLETRTVYISDSVRYYTIRQSYSGGGLKITSPIAGYIHELKVAEGEFVSAGQLIATVSSDKRLLLRADVPQQYFNRINDIVTTHFRTSYSKEVWKVRDLNGILLAVGSSVAENNQYLPVYFEAQNNGQLLEGAFAEFFLQTKPEENCINVPVGAVLEEQGKYYVFVQVSGEFYQKQEILIGDFDGINYRVLAGLAEGERIVTRGSMLLKTASMSTSLPGQSHQH